MFIHANVQLYVPDVKCMNVCFEAVPNAACLFVLTRMCKVKDGANNFVLRFKCNSIQNAQMENIRYKLYDGAGLNGRKKKIKDFFCCFLKTADFLSAVNTCTIADFSTVHTHITAWDVPTQIWYNEYIDQFCANFSRDTQSWSRCEKEEWNAKPEQTQYDDVRHTDIATAYKLIQTLGMHGKTMKILLKWLALVNAKTLDIPENDHKCR